MILLPILLQAAEIDCGNAQTQLEMTICAGREFEAADAALNAQWALTAAEMKALDAEIDRKNDRQPGHYETLLEGQRAWLTFRDAHCAGEGFKARGGSLQPMLEAYCRAQLTALRTQQLRDLAVGLESPAQVEGEPIVVGQSWSLYSAALGDARTINVWTPPGYAEGEARYPVLYLLDGGLEQDFEHIAGLAQLGALSWLTREFVVVGVETVDRQRELAFPVERDEQLRKDYPTAGESALFRRYLVEEAKPFVAEHYRVSDEDAVLGESLAGLFIVETLLRQPEAFDTYIAIDPSTWWDEGRLTEEAPELLARQGGERRRLWLGVGRETLEQPGPTERLLAALRARPEVELRYEPRPQLTHATIYHPTAWEALQALYPRPDEVKQ